MGAQQNAAGEYLNYKPHIVIGGPGYASTLALLRSAANEGNADGESDGNIITLIDARLSGSTKWFTVAFKSPCWKAPRAGRGLSN